MSFIDLSVEFVLVSSFISASFDTSVGTDIGAGITGIGTHLSLAVFHSNPLLQ